MKTQHVTFVSGYICSGKSRYGKQNPEAITISVSGIIKEIIKANTRKELQATAHLDYDISQKLMDVVEGEFGQQLIIDGIRQVSIFNSVQVHLDQLGIEWKCVWIEVPIEICKKRFEAKNDGKENISFEEAFERDKQLGLLDLKQLWKENNCTIINNY